MIAPRCAIPSFLLLLLTSGRAVYALPAADNTLNARTLGNLTEEQLQRIQDLESLEPECVRKCAAALESQQPRYIPRCAATDQSSSEAENAPDMENAYSCLCTDKQFLADNLACIVNKCGSNSTAFDIALNTQYGTCKLYADVNYPKPEVFLNDLCLLDDLPKGATVPTDVSFVSSIWPDYTFAKDFPQKTATTWVPTGTALADFAPSGYTFSEPKWTCTPTLLADSASQGSTSASTSTSGSEVPTPTSNSGASKGNSTVTPAQGSASSGKHGMLGISVVVAAVAGLAIFL